MFNSPVHAVCQICLKWKDIEMKEYIDTFTKFSLKLLQNTDKTKNRWQLIILIVATVTRGPEIYFQVRLSTFCTEAYGLAD